VIEYSDLPAAVANRRRGDGLLEIWAGSIAVHAMDVAFLRRMTKTAGGLPFHVARKKVPHVDSAGDRVEPTAPNAIKFERFIFDLLPSAENAVVVEVDAATHFAPLKNGPGEKSDTALTVQTQMIDLHAEWLRRAGASLSEGVVVEISPLYALDAEQLAEKVMPGTRVTEATYFC
jgi:UDP-N-acetylglucosamine/UDP-N-acetylgalactosamine diphosphorylase